MNESAIFGPSIENVWKKKRKQRTGLTSGRLLPEDIAHTLGNYLQYLHVYIDIIILYYIYIYIYNKLFYLVNNMFC